MSVNRGAWISCAAAAGLVASAFAQSDSPPPDKSAYTLFDPTPKKWMREMSTDRPDMTESPYTVDAGHFQVESDLLTYAYARETGDGADTRVDAWRFATLNLKVGLCNQADFQVILNPCNTLRTEDRVAGTVRNQCGFGDITLRLKVNCWGNDGGATAFGIMPFVKIPSNQNNLGNDAVEGGLILPLAVNLPGGWSMGLMTQCYFNKNAETGRYDADFINSITFGHDIVGNLAGYVEFFSLVSTAGGSQWIGTLDLGLTFSVTEDVQLDAGVNIGVTSPADVANPFLGLSFRY